MSPHSSSEISFPAVVSVPHEEEAALALDPDLVPPDGDGEQVGLSISLLVPRTFHRGQQAHDARTPPLPSFPATATARVGVWEVMGD